MGEDDGEQAAGTPQYMSPEQVNGQRLDPRSDLFFLGAVLYELATGTSPYPPTKSFEDRKMFSRYSGIRPIRRADPNINPRVADIIDRLLKIIPQERYQSATEVLIDLRAALKELGGGTPEAEAPKTPRL